MSGSVLRAILVAVALLLAACAPASPNPDVERAAPAAVSLARAARGNGGELALGAGRAFLDRYLAPDGRIIRHDQGGDVVSEGQAYGMLVAVALEDRAAFDAVWGWTKGHLRRPDGMLAWRWQDGSVIDDMPASDADVDAAHALALAAERFDEPSFADDARSLADAVLAHSTVVGPDGPVVVAGPWAVEARWVNPSYGAPAAFDALAEVVGDPTWDLVDDGARRVVRQSTAGSDLPSDWAVLTGEQVEPRGAPAGGPPQHGYDAVRTAVRLAIDCEPAGRALAAAMADEYRRSERGDGHPPAVLELSGDPAADHAHPAATVGAAASSLAAGDPGAATDLLERAAVLDAAAPSYYGAAWVALGRLWLTTELLGGCAGDPT